MSIETIPIIKRLERFQSDGHVYNVRAQDSLSNRRNTTAYGIRSKNIVPHLAEATIEIGHTGRQQKQADEKTLFFRRGFYFNQWRYYGY